MLIILRLMTSSTNNIGYLVHDTARLMRKRFDRFAAETGMTRAQWQVLGKVARAEGINQASLADLLDIEPITVCRMIDRLEGAGLVERRPDPADRRARLIYMTEAARPGLERMRAVADEVFAEMLAGFTPEEAATLLALLGRVQANLAAPRDAEAPALARTGAA